MSLFLFALLRFCPSKVAEVPKNCREKNAGADQCWNWNVHKLTSALKVYLASTGIQGDLKW